MGYCLHIRIRVGTHLVREYRAAFDGVYTSEELGGTTRLAVIRGVF